MWNALNRLNAARLRSALLVGTGLLLAGCSTDDLVLQDRPTNDNFYERYPITVAKKPVKMGVSTNVGTLQPSQINAVSAFGREALKNSYSQIVISYPSGASHGRQMASDVGELLIQQGVPASMITARSYAASAGSPVELSYTRKVAVTKECGDWSQNLASDYSNRDYPNFGCAVQHNTAAMVANAEDFETMRPMDPASASARLLAMKLYYSTGTTIDGGVKNTGATKGG